MWNMSVTFFSVSMYSKRINPLFISSRINWHFISICFDLWWMIVFLVKTILDWLLQWIVVEFLSDSSSVIVLNSAPRLMASWLVNDTFRFTCWQATEFHFLDFHEIIGLFSANLKQNLLTLFLSFKLAQSASQNPSNFKGFCDFLNICDWLFLLNNVRRVLPLLNGKNLVLLVLETT